MTRTIHMLSMAAMEVNFASPAARRADGVINAIDHIDGRDRPGT